MVTASTGRALSRSGRWVVALDAGDVTFDVTIRGTAGEDQLAGVSRSA